MDGEPPLTSGSRVLTPSQERILARLRREPEPIVFDAEAIAGLVGRARDAFGQLSARLGGEKLTVGKSFLTDVHGCEAKYLAPRDFAWRPATAAGFVAHRAIELAMNWRGEPVPGKVVDEAIARLADEPSNRGDYVAALGEGDLADLRSHAVERLTNFLHDFPPLNHGANPVFEGRLRWSPSACIELIGKPDLVIGRPEGRISRRVIIDIKSGWRSAIHRADLHFYALVETLVREVPPRKVVSYYLDEADVEVEDVTLGILDAALDRAIDAVAVHAELTIDRRAPEKRPGGACRWCPLAGSCDEGTAHLTALDDRGDQGFDD